MFNSIISFFTGLAVTVTSFFSGGVTTEITDTLLVRAILEPGTAPRVTLVESLKGKEKTFVKTNADGTFTVTAPEGVSYAKIKAWGGAGGAFGNDGGPFFITHVLGFNAQNMAGGHGGYVSGQISISGGETIQSSLGSVGPNGRRKGDNNDWIGGPGTATRVSFKNKEIMVAGAGSNLSARTFVWGPDGFGGWEAYNYDWVNGGHTQLFPLEKYVDELRSYFANGGSPAAGVLKSGGLFHPDFDKFNGDPKKSFPNTTTRLGSVGGDGKQTGSWVYKALHPTNMYIYTIGLTGGTSYADEGVVKNPLFYSGDPEKNTIDGGAWKDLLKSGAAKAITSGGVGGAVVIEFYKSVFADSTGTLPVCDLTELISTDTVYNNGSNTTVTKETPSGTKSVKIKAVGAGGGSNPGYNTGGAGGYAEAVFNLGSDEQILVTPGSEGRQPGIAHGGASGGGMTKVVTSQGAVWAGGGGGAGGYGGDKGYIAGAGGNGGTPNGTEGGQAWYRYGNPEEGGKGATPARGGRGGIANGGDSNGQDGRMEQGGQGGYSPFVQYSVSGFNGGGRAGGGGGGGGGYFGGGGGGTPLGYGVSGDNGSGSGGGGGGSSFVSGTPVGVTYTTTNKWWLEGEFGKRKVGLSDGPGGVILEYYGVPASKADKCTDPTKDEVGLSLGVTLNGRNVNGDFIPKNSRPTLSWSFTNVPSKDTCSLKKTSSFGTAFETVAGTELASSGSKITDALVPALYTFKLECVTPALSKDVSFTVNEGVCVNGATNYPICSTGDDMCLNGAKNPPLCSDNGGGGITPITTIPPVTGGGLPVLTLKPEDTISVKYIGGKNGVSENKSISLGTTPADATISVPLLSIVSLPSLFDKEITLLCSTNSGASFSDCKIGQLVPMTTESFGGYKANLQIKISKKLPDDSNIIVLKAISGSLSSNEMKLKILQDVKNPNFTEF